jgi:two-component system CheB/CheR fusion protein
MGHNRWVDLADSAELRTLVTSMAEGVVVHSASGEIVLANAQACTLLGLTEGELFGRDSFDPRWRAVHEDGSPFPGEEHPAMVALRTGREVRDVVFGVRNPAEERHRWLVVSAAPRFRPGEPSPCEVFSTFSDITELRLASERLAQALRFNQEIISSVGAGITVYDRNLCYVAWNPFMERLTGTPAQDVL